MANNDDLVDQVFDALLTIEGVGDVEIVNIRALIFEFTRAGQKFEVEVKEL